jgi:hypothetical protein
MFSHTQAVPPSSFQRHVRRRFVATDPEGEDRRMDVDDVPENREFSKFSLCNYDRLHCPSHSFQTAGKLVCLL